MWVRKPAPKGVVMMTCDDCGTETPVLMLTDYGCRYCRRCFRPGLIAAKPKKKKAKETTEHPGIFDQGEDVF